MDKPQRFAFGPGLVVQGKSDPPVERRVTVKPNHNKRIGIRVGKVLFTQSLESSSFSGIGVRHYAVRHLQRKLVGLVFVMPRNGVHQG